MKSILLIGGGGHCKSVYDSLKRCGGFDRVGLVVNDAAPNSALPPIVGGDCDLKRLYEQGWSDAFIAVGSVGDTSVREKLFALLRSIGFTMPSIIDPTSVIAENVNVGCGCYIGKRAVINAECKIGECAIVNTGAIVEHDCTVGRFSHIAPGAVLCGNVRIGDYTHIGAGASLKQGIAVGSRTLIGLGSVVLRDFSDNVKALGNPCREIE